MSTISLTESGSCALNHHYHYIQYPCVVGNGEQHQLGGGGNRVSGYYEQPPMVGGRNAGEESTSSLAPTYCNCRCSCGGGGLSFQSPQPPPPRHAPQNSIDSQMAVPVIVHRQSGGQNSVANKSQSEQSLLRHSYQQLQPPSVDLDEEKPLNVFSGGVGHNGGGGIDTPNIRCACECDDLAACECVAPREIKSAPIPTPRMADAMLGVDEITVSESDNNSGTLVKKKRVRNSDRSAKKFNASWCSAEQVQADPLPSKRCLCLSQRESPSYGVYSDDDNDNDENGTGTDNRLHHGHRPDCHRARTVGSGGVGDDIGDGRCETRPPLPPRPPPTRPRSTTAMPSGLHHNRLHARSAGTLTSAGGAGHGSGGHGIGGGIKKYVVWCLICGGFSCLLGILFLGVYFFLHSYTITVGNFETVPTFVPATLLILTGLCVICLAKRKNRYGYLIKLSGACGLISALTCALVTVTTTVLHMSRLQALRECEYAQKTRTCTCYSDQIESQVERVDKEGVRLVFDSLSDCGVVHGSLYSCLRAIFALSVAGVLVAVFSCMLVYQLLSHERKKMYWEQLELRCRSLYTSTQQQGGPPPASIAALTAAAAGGPHGGGTNVCRCCEQCHAHRQAAAAAAAAAYAWEEGGEPRFWTGQPPGNFYSPNPGSEMEQQQHQQHFAAALAMSGGRCHNGAGSGIIAGTGGVAATALPTATSGSTSGAGGNHRGRSTGWSWPRSWPWQRSSPDPNNTASQGGGRFTHSSHATALTPSSPDSQYGFSNGSNAVTNQQSDSIHGGTLAPADAGLAMAMGVHCDAAGPYNMMAAGMAGGAVPPYGVWGPPPPYSDPNSPARRGYYQYVQPSRPLGASANGGGIMMCPSMDTANIVPGDIPPGFINSSNNEQAITVLQQQQQQQLDQQQTTQSCLNHRSVFLDPPGNLRTTGSNVTPLCCGSDTAGTQRCCATTNIVPGTPGDTVRSNTGKRQPISGSGGVVLKNKDYGVGEYYANARSDTSDGGGGGVGRLYEGIGIGGGDCCSNTLPTRKLKKRVEASGGVKSIGPHGPAASERRNVQQLFASTTTNDIGQATQPEELSHPLGGIDNSAFSQNSKTGGGGTTTTATSGDRSGVAHRDVSEGGVVGDHSESEVYFADVSSCCNVSVKNDNNYYESATNGSGSGGHVYHQPQVRHQHQCSGYSQSSSCCDNNNTGSTGKEGNSNEDYLAARFGGGYRGNSKRSRLPFPASVDESTAVNNNSSYLPKDTSRQSMCSMDSADDPKTDLTDLSPSTPSLAPSSSIGGAPLTITPTITADDAFVVASFAAYTSEAQSLEAHRRSTKNIHEMMLQAEVNEHHQPAAPGRHLQPPPTHHISASGLVRPGKVLGGSLRKSKRTEGGGGAITEKLMMKVTKDHNKGGEISTTGVTAAAASKRTVIGGGGSGSGGDGERLVRL